MEEDEGCLSIPGVYHATPRSATVRIAGLDVDGRPSVLEGEALLARIFQHETDHAERLCSSSTGCPTRGGGPCWPRCVTVSWTGTAGGGHGFAGARGGPAKGRAPTPAERRAIRLPRQRPVVLATRGAGGLGPHPGRRAHPPPEAGRARQPFHANPRRRVGPGSWDFAYWRSRPSGADRGSRRSARRRPDVLVVVAYGEILPPAVLDAPRVAPVNLHFSLLPELRGAAPVQRALLEGLAVTGATTIRMDPGMDTGPILLSAEEPISEDDDAGSLGARLAVVGARLLVDTLDRLEAGTLVERPQDHAAATPPRSSARRSGPSGGRRTPSASCAGFGRSDRSPARPRRSGASRSRSYGPAWPPRTVGRGRPGGWSSSDRIVSSAPSPGTAEPCSWTRSPWRAGAGCRGPSSPGGIAPRSMSGSVDELG